MANTLTLAATVTATVDLGPGATADELASQLRAFEHVVTLCDELATRMQDSTEQQEELLDIFGRPIPAEYVELWAWLNDCAYSDVGSLYLHLAGVTQLMYPDQALDTKGLFLALSARERVMSTPSALKIESVSYRNPIEWVVLGAAGFGALKILRGVLKAIREWQHEGRNLELKDIEISRRKLELRDFEGPPMPGTPRELELLQYRAQLTRGAALLDITRAGAGPVVAPALAAVDERSRTDAAAALAVLGPVVRVESTLPADPDGAA